MNLKIMALFFCGTSIASEAQVLTVEELASAPHLTIKEIREKYGQRPEVVDLIIGIKLAAGLGLPAALPEQGFKMLLNASLHRADARAQVFRMCQQGLCFPGVVEQRLDEIIAEARKNNYHAIALLIVLNATKKIPSSIRSIIGNALAQLSTKYPKSVYAAAYELQRFDPQASIASMTKLADEYNNVLAAEVLGSLYYYGTDGAPQDRARALTYLEKAADLGSVKCAHLVGQLYLTGDGGMPQDRQRAFKFIEQAARGGDAASVYSMGVFYATGDMVPPDMVRAIELLNQAAALGSSKAYTALARFVEEGYLGQTALGEPDYHKAFELFNAAADRGDLDACFSLGFFYDTGLAGSIDHKRAQRLYKKVLDTDRSDLDGVKAHMYAEGIGVKQDLEKAREYYRKTIARGYIAFNEHLRSLDLKIEAAKRQSSSLADHVEIPSIARQQQKPTPEQVAYGQRKSAEALFKRTLNSKFPVSDESEVSEVDFENNSITIIRPSDGTTMTITIDDPEQKRRFKKAQPYQYDERVATWFKSISNQDLTRAEYNSAIRHAFPQKADLVAQLFGYKTSEPGVNKSKATLAIAGTLIPGKTQQPLSGTFVYGYDGDRLYHRFLHLNTPQEPAT